MDGTPDLLSGEPTPAAEYTAVVDAEMQPTTGDEYRSFPEDDSSMSDEDEKEGESIGRWSEVARQILVDSSSVGSF